MIEDAASDPRTIGHPKRDELSTYIGVPLFRADGSMFGTLCGYDPLPLRLDEKVQSSLEQAIRELHDMLSWLIDHSTN